MLDGVLHVVDGDLDLEADAIVRELFDLSPHAGHSASHRSPDRGWVFLAPRTRHGRTRRVSDDERRPQRAALAAGSYAAQFASAPPADATPLRNTSSLYPVRTRVWRNW